MECYVLIIGTLKKNTVNRLNKNVHDYVKIQIEIGFGVPVYVAMCNVRYVHISIVVVQSALKHDSFIQKVQEDSNAI